MSPEANAEPLSASAVFRAALDAIVVAGADNRIVEFNPRAEALFGYARDEVLGRDLGEVMIPESLREAHRQGMQRHLQTGRSHRLNTRLELPALRKDGSVVPVELTVARLHEQGQPVFVAFIRDITERRQLEASRSAYEARLIAVVRAQQILAASDLGFDALVDTLAGLAQEALRGDGGVFELLEGDELVYHAVSGAAVPSRGQRVPVAGSLSGAALLGDRALHCADCALDPRVSLPAVRAVGVNSMIVAPVHQAGRPLGVLKVLSGRPAAFGEDDARALELLARSVGAVLERKLIETERQRALAAQAAVVEVQRELATSDRELTDLLDEMTARAQQLLGGSGAAVEFVEGDELVYQAVSGNKAGRRGLRIPIADSLSGLALREDRVLHCQDSETDVRVNRDACRLVQARSMLVAPLHWQGRVTGVLKVTSTEPNAFGPEQVRNLEILGETLGLLVERANAHAALKRAASIDAVTQLPRFAAVESRWDEQLAATARGAMLLVNLDRFHALNESLGHVRADEVLARVAQRLRELCEGLAVAHFAGDEYAVLCPEADEAQATAWAERIRARIAERLEGGGYRVRLTATVGLAVAPQHGRLVHDLVRRAQYAMEMGKKLGRDRTSVFRNDQMQDIEDRVLLGEALREAPERGELELHYQPKVHARSRRVVGFEALLRWKHPELGQVPPARFIPVAEALGLMEDIGGWVIGEAARQARVWLDEGAGDFTLSVNVSAHQLQRDGLVDVVSRALQGHALPARVLQIEVTESSLMENVSRVQGELARLKGLGVSVSLDDFGTGYSSLAYLKEFSLDQLKIDRRFVKGLPDNADDRAIAGLVVAIGHQLGLEVIAEGVETAEQADFLDQLGCDGLQGYFFGRPLPAAEARRQLPEPCR